MTKEDKELLLRDLCARSFYGVMADYVGECIKVKYVNPHSGMIYISYFGITKWEAVEVIKPYLRPMSSMTNGEKRELGNFVAASMFASRNKNPLFQLTREALYGDFFNKHHFDYRGLIEKGLALEALEGMYNV